jgi:hypothetical protein
MSTSSTGSCASERRQASSDALVFHASGVGLANRLRALVGYQALSECLDLKLSLLWTADTFCNAEFRDLFEPSVPVLTPERWRENLSSRLCTAPDWFHDIWRDHLSTTVAWPDFLRIALQKLSALEPRDVLARTADTFASKHGLSGMLGVHIRYTDNVVAYRSIARSDGGFNTKRISSMQGFVDEIGRYVSGGGGVFLATDNPDVEQFLRRRFGARILTYSKDYFAQSACTLRTSTVSEALIEMLLLGRCAAILGTYYSSFSKLSAIWAGVPYYEVNGRDCVQYDLTAPPVSAATGA